MEKITPLPFLIANSNLTKNIFSYLNIKDQRMIYNSNKSLRRLLPDPGYELARKIFSLKKRSEIELGEDKNLYELRHIFEFSDESIALISDNHVRFYKKNPKNLGKFKRVRTVANPHKNMSPKAVGDNLIFKLDKEIEVYDKNFKIVQKLELNASIIVFYALSDSLFAVWSRSQEIEFFMKNQSSQLFESFTKFSLFTSFIPYNIYILENSIIIPADPSGILIYCLKEKKIIKEINDMGEYFEIFEIVDEGERKFASSMDGGKIQFLNLRQDHSIKLNKMIHAHKRLGCRPTLKSFGKDYLLSIDIKSELKIWNLRTYECLKEINVYKNYVFCPSKFSLIISSFEDFYDEETHEYIVNHILDIYK